jgi:hypothetical protein
MGQQQLLLLILASVIVGLAVIAGIDAFEENQVRSNADAMTTEVVDMASDFQAWALKPNQFEGGGGWSNFTASNVGFADVGIDSTSTYTTSAYEVTSDPTNLSGTCGLSSGDGKIFVGGQNTDYGNSVCVAIDGPNSEDITTDITYGN